MGMNQTLKEICALLKQRDVELQIAAIRVLGGIKVTDSAIIKMLGELLATSGNPNVRRAVLAAFEDNPHDQGLRYLIQNLEKDEATLELTIEVISRVGSKAISQIKKSYDKVSPQVQRTLVTVLPRVRTTQAHLFFVDCCFSEDAEVIRNVVHSLRENIDKYTTREQGDLRDKLTAALKDKRIKSNPAALSAIIISLGIIGQVQVKTKLIPFLTKDFPITVRRHALMSLARFEYVGTRHQDVFEAVLPILNEKEYEELVRHAVQVLARIKPRRADNAKIRSLLENKHSGVQTYAIGALGKLDSMTNAESLLALLHSSDLKIREAAAEALRHMPSAVSVILKHIDLVKDKKEAFEMVSILESHGNRIKPDHAKGMIKHMLELYFAGDEHYQLYKMALRHLRGDVLQKEIKSIAAAHKKKGKWELVRDTLKVLDHTELLSPEIRFDLAIAKLKTSKKSLARSFRQSDYCLEHFAILIAEDSKGLHKNLVSSKNLEPEDLYYLGFHYSEQHNEERRFGIEMLRYLNKKFNRKQMGKDARAKIKLEGH